MKRAAPALFLLLLACGPGAEVSRGRELYLAYGCAACHGERADGNGPAAPLAHIKPRDLTDLKHYRGPSSVEGISSTIAFGVADGVTGMPAYPDIPKRERTAIAEYIHSLASAEAKPPRVTEAWIRAPHPAQDIAAGYITVENPAAAPVALTGVTSPAVKTIELHEMKTENGMMTMRKVERMAVPPQGTLMLSPGGAHLMLIGLRQREGEVALRFTFDDGSVAHARAVVRNVE